ncbi:hypothetical protein KAX75_11890 [candidate division WOR-3 bacterium]|nr:hypothetical protein [candidate division WOR-3 bacterium]
MSIWERLSKIDRRIIYLLLALVIIIPIVFRIPSTVAVSESAQMAYDVLDGLPAGTPVLFSTDFDPASMPELRPMMTAVLRHAFKKKLKVIMMGHWPTGIPLSTIILEEVAQEFDVEYGVDYINIGYRPGAGLVMIQMGREIRSVFDIDITGEPLDSFPMMKPIHNYSDIGLVACFEAGDMGEIWARYAWGRFGVRIIMGTTAVVTPDIYPYLGSRQIEGLIGGMAGAAAYEKLIEHPDKAMIRMSSQAWAHILIVLFIVIGNIGFFMMRRIERIKKKRTE